MKGLLPSPFAKHKGVFTLGVVVLVLLLVSAVWGDHGLLHLLRIQHEQGELERMAFELQQRNEQLRQQIRRLQSDDLYLEKVARERLGLVKKGELVYRLGSPTPPRLPAE